MDKNSKVIAVIPARGGSKRLPHKNILPLNGIPLIAHSILYAQKHAFIDEVIVSTDSLQIAEISKQFNAKVIQRPKEISGDFEPTITALQHVVQQLDQKPENIILLQPTNPLRPENLLEEAFSVFQENQLNALFSVSPHIHKIGKIQNNKFLPFNYKYGQRSQDLEPFFYENGLLYITKSDEIIKGNIITEDAYPFQVHHVFGNVDIDSQTDFDYATFLLQNNKI